MTIISIRGTIGWDVTPNDIRSQLKQAKGDLMVEIASPGGFVFDGLDIFNLIRDYKGGKVTTKLMGIAASMASVIALAGSKVIAHDNAVFMIHNAMNIVWGNHIEMREMADHLEKVSNHLAKIYVRKTGKSIDEIKKLLDADSGSGTYLFGEEMKELGFVDEIIEAEDDNNSGKDKDSAVIEAMLQVENCAKQIKESENAKKDLQKAAACIGSVSTINKPEEQNLPSATSVENNTTIKKENTMNDLEKFLAENSGAMADYKKAIAAAGKAGEEKIQAIAEKAASFMTDAYPKAIHTKSIEVIQGKASMDVVEAMVGMHDMNAENKNSDVATGEELPETAAEETSGEPTAEENFQAKKTRVGV